MRTLAHLLLGISLCPLALADVPQKAALVKYTGLWTNSPFTSKPPPPVGGGEVNPLEDFMLTGIAPVPGGYRITIENKKNSEQKKIIEPGGSEDFKVVSVKYDPEMLFQTTVVLSAGNMQGTVKFEPELVTLKAAPAAAPAQQGNPGLPPGVNINAPPVPPVANPGQQGGNPSSDPNLQRQPRPRIVPPPVPSGNAAQPQNNGASAPQRRDIRR